MRKTEGIIIDFVWKLEREGKSLTTINSYAYILENLSLKGATINYPAHGNFSMELLSHF